MNNMKIESEFKLKQNLENIDYDIDFGTINRGADTKVIIKFTDVSHISLRKSCGCTMPKIELLPEGGFNLIVEYDNQRLGVISQAVWETVIDEHKEQRLITFNLKGKIV